MYFPSISCATAKSLSSLRAMMMLHQQGLGVIVNQMLNVSKHMSLDFVLSLNIVVTFCGDSCSSSASSFQYGMK